MELQVREAQCTINRLHLFYFIMSTYHRNKKHMKIDIPQTKHF